MDVQEVNKKLLDELEEMGFPLARAMRAIHSSGYSICNFLINKFPSISTCLQFIAYCGNHEHKVCFVKVTLVWWMLLVGLLIMKMTLKLIKCLRYDFIRFDHCYAVLS